MTEHAEKLNIAKLEKLKKQGYNSTDVINQSIEKGWQGLFPLNNTHQSQHQPTQTSRHITADNVEDLLRNP